MSARRLAMRLAMTGACLLAGLAPPVQAATAPVDSRGRARAAS